MSIRMTTPVSGFKGAFVDLVEPREDQSGKLKYGINLLIPKDHPYVKVVRAAIAEALQEKFGAAQPKKWRSPLKDGDEVDYDGFAGHWYFNAKTETKPQCVDAQMVNLHEKDELYSGAFYRITANAAGYDHPKGGKGVSIYLNNVQKIKDGEFMGSRTTAESDFDIVADDGVQEETAAGRNW